MSSQPIDFWFSIGSLYTYLTVMRIDRIEDVSDITFRWRPFSVRAIMREMDNRPTSKPEKLAYMWQDVERRAVMYDCEFGVRPPYPLKNFDLVNRVALVGTNEGWCADFVRATYSHWFSERQDASEETVIAASLHEIGQPADAVLAAARSDETEHAYKAATDEARALGIFGVPTFVARGALFWGDDRLEDAIRWHRHGTLKLRSAE